MISFDLKCSRAHVFEAWFRSSDDYERQKARQLLLCPVCGDMDVGKAVMAPSIPAKGNQRAVPAAPRGEIAVNMPAGSGAPDQMKALLGALAEAQAKALETSQWVGASFSEKARSMHYGEIDHSAIHGTASADEARAMIEEGLAIAPLLVPIVPPDQTN